MYIVSLKINRFFLFMSFNTFFNKSNLAVLHYLKLSTKLAINNIVMAFLEIIIRPQLLLLSEGNSPEQWL